LITAPSQRGAHSGPVGERDRLVVASDEMRKTAAT
jgi:hypothetical protein